jgi:hypothetical protein
MVALQRPAKLTTNQHFTRKAKNGILTNLYRALDGTLEARVGLFSFYLYATITNLLAA